ncbi:MAG: HAMP domain-containing histidine kinase [Alphaproteobacteria bacterium]|nr:HAMP domain-containing histidine kinase [Alphaproteobacteria bacterium]
MIGKSLTLRTGIAALLWITLALGTGGWVILNVYSASAARQFDQRLEAHLDLLTAALAASPSSPNARMANPKFDRIFSGLYWQAVSQKGGVYRSRSLWDSELVFEITNSDEIHIDASGPDGQSLRLLARNLEGTQNGPWTLAVAADRSELEEDYRAFQRTLLISSAILGLALLGAAILMLRAALSPLNKLRRAVSDRHSNGSGHIEGAFPSEIEPLVTDLNTLLERNERLREKGRVQAANLAHALKTPAAILRNELTKAARGDQLNVALAQEAVENVSAAADRHLSLVTAGPDDRLPGARSDVVSTAAEVIRALTRLFADKQFTLDAPTELKISLARSEQLEVLGNLVENAGKWSQASVGVKISETPEGITITVDDDGPGVAPEDRVRILQQGVRLDESGAGSGLGLTIVSDIVERHKGKLELEASPRGGLGVRLWFPS